MLVPVIPVACLASVFCLREGRRRWFFGAAAAVGLAVNALGVLVHPLNFYRSVGRLSWEVSTQHEFVWGDMTLVNFVPGFNPVSGHLWLLKGAGSDMPWSRGQAPGLKVAPELLRLDLAWDPGLQRWLAATLVLGFVFIFSHRDL